MQGLVTGDFRADVGLSHGRLLVVMSGSADFEQRPAFAGWIAELHEELLRLDLRRAALDFCRVDFMSSMCITALVGWLVDVMDLPLEQRYRIHLRYRSGSFWQRKCVAALERLAMPIVSTEGVPSITPPAAGRARRGRWPSPPG